MEHPVKNVILTGGSGFIGRRLLDVMSRHWSRDNVIEVSRSGRNSGENSNHCVQWDSLQEELGLLADANVIIHLAGLAHVLKDAASDAFAEYYQVNVERTLELAKIGVEAGVQRFVYVSSIKVNGEQTLPDSPFHADDVPAPEDAYGQSKMEAEEALKALGRETGMEIVIIRPVLVYGPGVKGNFRALLSWVKKGLPLPLASVDNRRSFVAIDNLVDLLVTCVDHPAAANQTFLVSDGEDLSTPDLLRRLASTYGQRGRLFPFPVGVLRWMAALAGKRGAMKRLTGSLQVDMTKTQELLDWTPPVSVDDALKAVVQENRDGTGSS
ncbi:UDP-glucose 4-epimerase [Tamilnaduibacter salinus]|uniref:UDP-glucose 4-epimerase n=1 Tax=Tamilnaduibacter salinus TaxID=1484056 RepID=A0A2A2HZM4_9GAMM|nr:SDR family oxidoreductase [Tamilnaduibacter salinus]PAV24879.1 hypothetical protein CF392_13860 [Tamilnaduibacter salinus]PVY79064.1 UDP-glucose 4-epimerase [Tamilnaduibacter salinus]